MHFRYTPVPDWPPLAWLACGHRGDPTVEVFHGLEVETTPDGFSEAVWDGEFARAGFDETDLVFGSGARRRGGGVTFVSSGSTVDRLHSHEVAGRVCVANSLACLLVAIGADVDPTYAGYYADFKSISDGLVRYARSVATSAGPVLPFLAADAKGEDVYFRGAEAHLARRVLVTGYHGDQMWSKRPRAPSADIVRGDQSGLSLSEYRLWAGFIHLPVPFLGVRQIGDVSALSRSPAMAPWDVRGTYSRPICRRIVETAGVPRDAFGVRKQTASVLFFERDDMLSPGSLADYGAWLREHAAHRSARGLAAPTRSPSAAARLRAALARLAPPRLRNALGLAHRSRLFPHLFPSAVARAKPRYHATPYEVIAERHLRAPEQGARALAPA